MEWICIFVCEQRQGRVTFYESFLVLVRLSSGGSRKTPLVFAYRVIPFLFIHRLLPAVFTIVRLAVLLLNVFWWGLTMEVLKRQVSKERQLFRYLYLFNEPFMCSDNLETRDYV